MLWAAAAMSGNFEKHRKVYLFKKKKKRKRKNAHSYDVPARAAGSPRGARCTALSGAEQTLAPRLQGGMLTSGVQHLCKYVCLFSTSGYGLAGLQDTPMKSLFLISCLC